MIEIKHRETGEVLLRVAADTLEAADLNHAELSGADLGDVNLAHAHMSGANLRQAYLVGADLRAANLSGANLSQALLNAANLTRANLAGAVLSKSSLTRADLTNANLLEADLTSADLTEAILTRTELMHANLAGATVGSTTFSKCYNLKFAKGLAEIRHLGGSILDRPLLLDGIHALPDVFLEGCGYARQEIAVLRILYRKGPSLDPERDTDVLYQLLDSQPIQFFSCFISHGEPDILFAEKLLEDLRKNNVTCWHYKEDLRGGTDWQDQINRAIKMHDKLILICSHSAVYRKNVVREILEAIRSVRESGAQKLYPIRLDDHILSAEMLEDEVRHVQAGLWPGVWVQDVNRKHIPDFSGWEKDNAKYQKEFKKLLKALQK